MLQWGVIWAYWAVLFVMAVVITIRGIGPMRRTIWTILAVCALQFALASLLYPSGSQQHALLMLVTDAIACVIITVKPAGKWQSVIGLSYIIQIGAHIGRLAANNPDITFYWWGLSAIAFLQLFFVGGWWAGEYHLRNRRGHADFLPAQARREGLG